MISASALEDFLQCPFLFFGRRTLRLKSRPPRPDQRLDFLLQGVILHQTLAAVLMDFERREAIFERIFEQNCNEKHVPRGYRREFLRRQLGDDLRRLLDDPKLPPGPGSIAEWPFEIPVAEDLKVRGRVDRIDLLADGSARIIDYKRRPQKLDERLVLQGPLYALAVEQQLGLRPTDVFYVGLRDQGKVIRWSATREWLEAGRERALAAAQAIACGEIAPNPADRDRCAICDLRDVCRFPASGATLAAAAAVSEE